MRYLIWPLLILSVSCFSSPPSSFNQAKKIAGKIFANHQQTLYCQCQYENKNVDLISCGMESANIIKRAHRIEWEHIMAAEHFGQHFKCWREPLCQKGGKPYKGRQCCERVDASFRHMESELYNLWPEVGLVNQARSNYRFAQLTQQGSYYGCRITIDKTSRQVEPSDEIKGLVARAHLFMSQQYAIPLSSSQNKLFLAWNKRFPPTAWEREWAAQIAFIEGYENPYITQWAS